MLKSESMWGPRQFWLRIRVSVSIMLDPHRLSYLGVYMSIFIYGSGYSISSKSGSDPGFCWPKIEKNNQLKKNILFWYKKNANYLSLGLTRQEKLKEKASLQPSKDNIQHVKKWNLLTFFYFCGSFCPPASGMRIRIRSRI